MASPTIFLPNFVELRLVPTWGTENPSWRDYLTQNHWLKGGGDFDLAEGVQVCGPVQHGSCSKVAYNPDLRKIFADKDVAEFLGNREQWPSIWLSQPAGSSLPSKILIDDELWQGDDLDGLGRYYSLANKPAEAQDRYEWSFTIAPTADGGQNSSSAVTIPLRIKLNLRSKDQPLLPSGDALDRLRKVLFCQSEILDVVPDYVGAEPRDPKDRLRYKIYRTAAAKASKGVTSKRSAVQRLVFGEQELPTAHWFLFLDALGGEFHLPNFLGGNTQWEWRPLIELGERLSFLANLACERGGIHCTSAGQPCQAVRPSPFRANRWQEAGWSSIGQTEPNRGWSYFAPAETFQNRDMTGSTSWSAIVEKLIDTPLERHLRLGVERRIANQLLLPRSPVLVELPSFGGPDHESVFEKEWNERVQGAGWLDLIASPIWPESRWAEGLFWDQETGDGLLNVWSMFGKNWQEFFYQSLFLRPANSGPEISWQPPYARLRYSDLGKQFVLGRPQGPMHIENFRLE